MTFRNALIVLCLLLAAFAVAQSNRPAPRAAAAPPTTDDSVTIQITFGYNRETTRNYSGSLRVTGGGLRKLDSWRFFQGDAVTGPNTWKLDIKRAPIENQPDAPNPIANGGPPPRNLVPAAIIATVDSAASNVDVQTQAGNFSIPIAQAVYGRQLHFLNGDVLVERVPRAEMLSPANAEQHDYSSVAVSKTGVVWTSWQAYQDRGDHVYVRRGSDAPVRMTAEKGDVFRTSIAEDQGGNMHVAWSERRGEDWFLIERVQNGAQWSAAKQIVSGHSPNMFHKLVPGAALRMVWVGHEAGASYLYAAKWTGSGWSEPQQIGGPSVWAPDAVQDREGNLLAAWDSYQNGNYDVFFRRVRAEGTPDAIEQVTASPRFEAHPSLTVDAQGRPWLAWDESGANWGKDWNHEDPYRSTTLYAYRSLRAKVKDAGQWKDAPDLNAAVPDRIRRYAQLPHLATDARGRIWALFQIRTSAINNRIDFWCSGGLWDLYLTTLENGAWTPASMIPNSTARPEVPAQIVSGGDRVWMTWANDGRRFGSVAPGYQGATMFHYNVWMASASSPAPQGNVSLTTAAPLPPAAAAAPESVHPNEKQDVARMRGYRVSVDGIEYRILRGDFHRHTEISADGSGDGSVEDYYRYMLDVAQMDTGIITDHNAGGDQEYSWWRTEKSHDLFHIRDRYTPLFGYERSVNYPNGHRNVVFDHRGVRTLPVGAPENRADVNSGGLVYPYLRQNRGICMEHSLATGQGTDYRDNDPDLEPLVEIYQGYHAGYEYEGGPRAESESNHVSIHGGYRPLGFWWNALAKGLRLGVQASSDHVATHCSYAMIYTPTTERTNIVENMRKRHAYAATDNILVDFEAEEPGGKRHLMGEDFAATGAGPTKLTAKIEGTDRVTQVELIRNNEFLYTQKPDSKSVNFAYVDQSPKPGVNYYYVRVTQADRNLAWSSPIWVRR